MTQYVDAATLKHMIADGDELALLDVREDGQFGEGHMLFGVPMPYSVLEARLGTQLPRRSTRTVLVDAGDGVAERAAARMATLGYLDVAVLAGGIEAWAAAGYVVFKGVINQK
jgi:rhodanese-related sulfurtransferase